MKNKIARVFTRQTMASPTDELSFFDVPPILALPEIDEVHISVAFTWDLKRAEWLFNQWGVLGVPVKIGGPATGEPSGDFEPGMYLKHGYTITSRGCPNRCPHCSVWIREPNAIELPIKDGYNILDDNILACSENHIRAVFNMLSRQKERVQFTGGLEAAILKPWHIDLLLSIRLEQMFFAYDTPDDFEPLVEACKMLNDAEIPKYKRRCYVLIGYEGDTFEKAEKRLKDAFHLGYLPYAMLFRDHDTKDCDLDPEWVSFTAVWRRPARIKAICKAEK